MTKSDLIATLCEKFPGFTKADIEVSVSELLGAMSKQLAHGGRIEIRGFGSFQLNYRPPRLARNPKTGDPVSVPAKYTPHFRPGREMRARIDATRNSR